MLDFRMQTFLKLCETMNYRQTAELLNMTQPAVTQHIQYLEKYYGCKLFEYNKHHLKKTGDCLKLERKVRAAFYMEKTLIEEIQTEKSPSIKMGATKTIADYVLPKMVLNYVKQSDGDFTLKVDNTKELLEEIDQTHLDFALIEGFFNKSQYGYQLFKEESFVGICNQTHPFAHQHVELSDILKQTLIIREPGSGTRTIFEDLLGHYSHKLEEFERIICISHFSMIKKLVMAGSGITFGYKSIVEEEEELSVFYIKGISVIREFNYVYLKGVEMEEKIKRFEANGSSPSTKAFNTSVPTQLL